MKVKKVEKAEKPAFIPYFPRIVYTPLGRQEDESSEGFKDLFRKKTDDFANGKIRYDKIGNNAYRMA